MVKVVLSPEHPSLTVLDLGVKFENGRAAVKDEVAVELLNREGLGIVMEVLPDPVVEPEPTPEPVKDSVAEQVPAEPELAPASVPVRLPSARATVKTWVEFMAANEIKHPADATKPEMIKLAQKHLEGGGV